MRDRTRGWSLEMQMRACQERLRVTEVPVRYRPRPCERSKISDSWVGAVRAAANFLLVLGRLSMQKRIDSKAR